LVAEIQLAESRFSELIDTDVILRIGASLLPQAMRL
jgi:hypothetical protein